MQLYNTLSRKKEEFKPLNSSEIGLYTCGPTVYNYAHIGNLRAYIFEDILKRVLKFNNYNVKHVMNITDVGHLTDDADTGEDKMEKGSRREGKTAWELAEMYTKAFKKDLANLNIIEPDIWCRATDYIEEQIDFIKKIEEKGFVYKISDGMYFDTAKYPDYAKLGKLNIEGQEEGARVEKNSEKRNSTDFALWKFSHKDEQRQMEWESPWGKGFPGWHLECSAMSIKHLGEEFDIHCGGIDHIPVHHTNERAQNWALTSKESVKYWMHGAFLNIASGDKMAKSGDNFITLQRLIDKNINPLAYRYLVLQTHYRSQMVFSWESLQAAQNGLNNLYDRVRFLKTQIVDWKDDNYKGVIDAGYKKQFFELINDDLNMPKALALVFGLIQNKDGDIISDLVDRYKQHKNIIVTLEYFDKVLGLNIKDVKINNFNIPNSVILLAEKREEARKNKKWNFADELRVKIENMGFEVEDGEDGFNIKSRNI